MAYGFAGHIGIGKETTWGTAVTRTDYIEAMSESLAMAFDRFETKNIVGHYHEPDDTTGMERNTGNLVYHGHPVSMGYAFNGAFGVNSVSVVLSGALFQNVFTLRNGDVASNAPLPAYTLEIARDVTTAHLISGVQFNTLQMAIAQNQDLRLTAGIIARQSTGTAKGSPSFPNSPTFPFTFDTCSLSIDGIANVMWESFSITLNNQLEGISAFDNSAIINRVRRTGPPMVRVAGTIEFNNFSEWMDFKSQTERRFTLNFTKSASFSLLLDLPRVVFTAYPVAIAGRGRIMVNMDGRARYHVGSGQTMKATLTTINTF